LKSNVHGALKKKSELDPQKHSSQRSNDSKNKDNFGKRKRLHRFRPHTPDNTIDDHDTDDVPPLPPPLKEFEEILQTSSQRKPNRRKGIGTVPVFRINGNLLRLSPSQPISERSSKDSTNLKNDMNKTDLSMNNNNNNNNVINGNIMSTQPWPCPPFNVKEIEMTHIPATIDTIRSFTLNSSPGKTVCNLANSNSDDIVIVSEEVSHNNRNNCGLSEQDIVMETPQDHRNKFLENNNATILSYLSGSKISLPSQDFTQYERKERILAILSPN